MSRPRAADAAPVDPVPAYRVRFEPQALQQAEWIEAHTGLAIGARIRDTLALGPAPHPYRRIRRGPEGMLLAVKEWRVHFSVAGGELRVLRVDSGFRPSQLAGATGAPLGPHREFLARWPRG